MTFFVSVTLRHTVTIGGRAFNVAGPRIWNLLPEEITPAQSLSMFRQRLKIFLFEKSYPDVIL